MESLPPIRLPHHKLLKLNGDYEASARAVKLRYVNDGTPGILRLKKGTGFGYYFENKKVTDKEILARIKKLVIPPAWTNVWICPLPNGHIQATGFDLRKRKQYRYHELWTLLRNETKFHRLYSFGEALPLLRLQLEKDLTRPNLCVDKVLATVISLMERTYIRIGNDGYEKLYGSYGLTTLKDNHVTINGSEMSFCFKGKKGIMHKISLRNKRLARMVKECRDIPGKELFQYFDADGARRSIDSGMVNDYIKEATGKDFTAKDFRTWAGSLNLLRALKSTVEAHNDARKILIQALDEVSKKLGNTRTVCRKYYIHPGLIRLYEENSLQKYLKELNEIEEPDNKSGITSDEKVLLKILKLIHN